MFEDLKTIKLSGEEYPIKCDLVVLEKIQDEFGSFDDFENGIRTWVPELDEDGEKVKDENGEIKTIFHLPDMRILNTALYFMVNEGEEIKAEKENRTPVLMSRDEIARKVELSPTILAIRLFDEYLRCFSIKNGETTQNQTNLEN